MCIYTVCIYICVCMAKTNILNSHYFNIFENIQHMCVWVILAVIDQNQKLLECVLSSVWWTSIIWGTLSEGFVFRWFWTCSSPYHTHTHTHTLTQSHTDFTHIHTRMLTHSLTYTHSITHTHSHSVYSDKNRRSESTLMDDAEETDQLEDSFTHMWLA